jgi:hypothetical protein
VWRLWVCVRWWVCRGINVQNLAHTPIYHRGCVGKQFVEPRVLVPGPPQVQYMCLYPDYRYNYPELGTRALIFLGKFSGLANFFCSLSPLKLAVR